MPPIARESVGIPRQRDTILGERGFNSVKQPKKSKKLSTQKINSFDVRGIQRELLIDDLLAQGFIPCPIDGKVVAGSHKDKIDGDMKMHTLYEGDNLGVLTGKRSNLFVVDLDEGGGRNGVENYKKITSIIEDAPALTNNDQWAKSLGVPVVKTPTGGYHLYYQQDERLEGNFGNKHNLGANVDLKNYHGYIVAPPSVYPGCTKRCGKKDCYKCKVQGKKYKWLVRPQKLKPLPELIVQLILGFRNFREGAIVNSTPFSKSKISKIREVNDCVTGDEELLDQADQYVSLINVAGISRPEWINIGIAIRSIDSGEEGFRTWDNWSCNDDAYDETKMPSQWDSLHPYTQGRKPTESLRWLRSLAMKDNPEKTGELDVEIRNENGHIKCENPRMLAPIAEVQPEQKVVRVEKDGQIELRNAPPTVAVVQNIFWNYAPLRATNVAWCKIFDALKGDNIVLVSKPKSKTDILWNEETKLWEKVHEDAIEYYITEVLSNAIQETIEYYNLRFINADADNRKSLQKLIKKRYHDFDSILSGPKVSHSVLKLLRGSHRSKDADFLDTLDQKRDLLSVKNGVVELRTKTLRPRRREDFMSFCTPYPYDPSLDTSRSHKFLMDLCLNDKPKKEYLHKSTGYWLTGEMSEEIFMLLVGVESTGKDTLQDRMKDALGKNYVVRVDIDTFLEKLGSSLPAMSQIAQMEGARLVLTTEPGPEKKFKSELIKSITGQTGVVGKMYHKDPRPFMPQCKVVFACNDKPKLPGKGAIQRRAVEFRLEAQFRDVGDSKDPFDKENPYHREKDANLKTAYKKKEHCQEWLAFCIEGAEAWYKKPDLKKNLPTDVLESTKAYFEENKDFVMEFVKQELNIHRNNARGDKTKRTGKTIVHKRYLSWLDLQDDVHEFVPRKPGKFYTQLTSNCGIREPIFVRGYPFLFVTFKTSPIEWENRVEAYNKENDVANTIPKML